jgi:hypothetical protein
MPRHESLVHLICFQPYQPYCDALGGCRVIEAGDTTIFDGLTAGCCLRCCGLFLPHFTPSADTVVVTAISHGLDKLCRMLSCFCLTDIQRCFLQAFWILGNRVDRC